MKQCNRPTAFLFPGQGSQKLGMLTPFLEDTESKAWLDDLAAEPEIAQLIEIIQSGPEDLLTRTDNAQPAILLASIAAYRALGLAPSIAAGHSLGEYSALVAGGAIALEEALGIVRKRGEWMQQAVPEGEGGMAAAMGVEVEDLRNRLANADFGEFTLEIANLNGGGQVILSGHVGALESAKERLGLRRVIPLKVSAPFHSSLMQPAQEKLSELLDRTNIDSPAFPIVCNVDVQTVRAPAAIRDGLKRQVTGTVRWEETMHKLIEDHGIETFVEIGPGKTLAGLARQIDKNLEIYGVSDLETAQKVREALV